MWGAYVCVCVCMYAYVRGMAGIALVLRVLNTACI